MNKTEAMNRLDAIEREAKELRRIIEAPEQTWKPEELVGKLCYLWDNNPARRRVSVVLSYSKNLSYPYGVSDNGHINAEPIPAAEVEKLIYRKSRYDWSKAPEDAKIAVTNDTGTMAWGSYDDATPGQNGGWTGVGGGQWLSFDDAHPPCPDWRDSLEHRP